MSERFAGRRLWFVGIGGAGLSAYAQLARAWGAEVGGWDRAETPYLAPLAGVRVELSPKPVVPAGWEAVVSSAYPAVAGLRRSEFLRELVSARKSIVVAGTHGKGTTAAMIAFVLRETGRDPAWLIGAPIPQLASNAGAGEGLLVVEGDESDRTVFSLPAEIAVVTNIELDHHSEFASLAELEAEFDTWLETAAHVVRSSPPFDGPLALPGEHNRRNAGAALAALELAGVPRGEAEASLALFKGTARRFEVHELSLIHILTLPTICSV
jgi:UDP-N-acetylmuramate--alanine ligase